MESRLEYKIIKGPQESRGNKDREHVTVSWARHVEGETNFYFRQRSSVLPLLIPLYPCTLAIHVHVLMPFFTCSYKYQKAVGPHYRRYLR